MGGVGRFIDAVGILARPTDTEISHHRQVSVGSKDLVVVADIGHTFQALEPRD